jgi:hypothetical protein
VNEHFFSQGWSFGEPHRAQSCAFPLFLFMRTLGISMSLPHMAGSLSATIEEATWVLTSYLVLCPRVARIGWHFAMVLC